MRKFAGLVVLVLITAFGFPLGHAEAAPAVPKPGSPGIGDPYYPLDGNGGYDVSHYALRVAFVPSTQLLTGRATITAKATQALSSFNLDLDGLTVDRIAVNGVAATWTRADGELTVTPAKALAKGKRFVVRTWYHGVPNDFDDSFGGGVIPTDDGAIVIGEPHVASTWFPVNDHPSDKASYTIRITVPKGVEAIANGRLSSLRKNAKTWTWLWRAKEPMASYLATATTGQFKLTKYTKSGIRYLDAIDPALFVKPKPTGTQFALSGSASSAYERLTRTFTVPAGGGRLNFDAFRDTEAGWDYFFVEAHRVGSSNWTTLPDLNGHTSDDTGSSCVVWPQIHPFLARYQTTDGQTCTATGTSGSWNAATGRSQGSEAWSVDLGAYAGQTVEVSLTVVTDDVVAHPGVQIDNVVGPGGQGTTGFEPDADPYDGWTPGGPPADSPGNDVNWHLGTGSELRPVGDIVARAFKREPEIIKYLSSIYGRYPFNSAGGIVDNDEPELGFALENQTRPIYSKAFFTSDPESASVVVHELSHQWTGDSLSVASWSNIWLNEGFATYAEWQWSEHEGDATAQDLFDLYATIPADSDFWSVEIGDPGPDKAFDVAVYYRGAMTLHALRQQVGDAKFYRILKTWTTSQAGGHVSIPEFVKLAERISGQHLDALFNEWLFTPAKPAGIEAPALRRSGKSGAEAERQLAHRTVRR